mmetsp:Transcript_13743/g.31847  ORF Transcript_13743/g.31847 Transcript_13743/m.31847 type:complete len:291 (-) Transcript_13743:12459-13331(-)
MPSCGESLRSSTSIFSTRVRMVTSSSAQPWCLRATSCRMAVSRPCGLKNPVSQKDLGRPLRSHLSHCSYLPSRPGNHTPSVGACHEISDHDPGTRASKRAFMASMSAAASTIVPAIASWRSRRVLRVSSRTFCRRSSSWRNAMLMGLVPPILLMACLASSMLMLGGIFCRSSPACALTMSSRVRPPEPPPPVLGCVSRMVSNESCAFCRRYTRSALVCRPKSSGLSVCLSWSITLRNTEMSEPAGMTYPVKKAWLGSKMAGEKYFSAYVVMSRRSQSSEMRPPYWISAIM